MNEQEMREKVIKDLEEVRRFIECENLPAHTLKAKLVIDDAIALLKAQEPVKPKPYDGFSYLCGKCERVISGKYSNCPWCGQAVKWE